MGSGHIAKEESTPAIPLDSRFFQHGGVTLLDKSDPYNNAFSKTDPDKPDTDADGLAEVEKAPMSRRRILKNLLTISIVFFLHFVAFGGLEGLQSSLNREEGLGVVSLSVLYGVMALSSLLLPQLVIQLLGYKWSMSVCLLGYDLWMAANGYAVWATMIPASILVGLSAAPLWTAMNCYLTLAARQYAILGGEDPRAVTAQFFGVFFAFSRLSSIAGSVIASTILRNRPENVTSLTDDELSQQCGLNHCPDTNFTNTNFDKPSQTVLWTLIGSYLFIATVAFIISCVFVDPLPAAWINVEPSQQHLQRRRRQRSGSEEGDPVVEGPCGGVQCRSVCSSLTATVRHMRHVPQLLLIPLTVYVSLTTSFFQADYNLSFVSCILGLWMVGWCRIPHSVVSMTSSFVGGRLAKFTGCLPLFIIGACCDLSFQMSLMFWVPMTSQMALLFVLPCLTAVCDGLFKAQLTALYGVLFATETEAAFSNFRFWESVGYIVAYAYSSQLCTSVKLYIVTSSLVVSFPLLLVVLLRYYRPKSTNGDVIISTTTDKPL